MEKVCESTVYPSASLYERRLGTSWWVLSRHNGTAEPHLMANDDCGVEARGFPQFGDLSAVLPIC